MLHAGMDMHKRFSVITVTDEDGTEVVDSRRVENKPLEISRFFENLEDEARVVLEAGPNWYWMCDLLDELGVQNILCHPLKTRAIASARIKTDKIDSATLSHLLRTDLIPESYKADIDTRHTRELMRSRAFLVKMRTALKNRAHGLIAKENVENPYSDLFGKAGTEYLRRLSLPPVYRNALDSYLEIIDFLNIRIVAADREVAKAWAGSADAKLLSTIPGVGPIYSLMISAEIGDATRFHSSRHLSSYAGLVPSTWQSGGAVRHGRITRLGSAWLRYSLVEAACNAVGRSGFLGSFYSRLKKSKGTSVARVAVARKLSTYVYHMLREGKDFSSVMRYVKGDPR